VVGEELLRVRNLRTYFDSRGGLVRAVDGVDLDIGAGRTLGLVGESGCGKSVTALSIMRLVEPTGRLDPDSGILFRGRDLATASEPELREVRGNEISMI
jgi:peptide/nickel transport system ATP-binding protein